LLRGYFMTSLANSAILLTPSTMLSIDVAKLNLTNSALNYVVN